MFTTQGLDPSFVLHHNYNYWSQSVISCVTILLCSNTVLLHYWFYWVLFRRYSGVGQSVEKQVCRPRRNRLSISNNKRLLVEANRLGIHVGVLRRITWEEGRLHAPRLWYRPWLHDFNYIVCLAEQWHINLICLAACNNNQTSTENLPADTGAFWSFTSSCGRLWINQTSPTFGKMGKYEFIHM